VTVALPAPLGAHVSTAGGTAQAPPRANAIDATAMQLFTKQANRWAERECEGDECAAFATALGETAVSVTMAHDSYLINLASPDDVLWQKSVVAFEDEVRRAERLGLAYLVTHPGAHVGSGEAAGLARVVTAIDAVHRQTPGFKVKILLELTAEQGSSLGHRFEHMATIFDGVEDPKRIGVCWDTCHVFAAGYPLAPEEDYQRTMAEFDRLIGLSRLKLFHLNDSKKPHGSRVDRHEHLGQGFLGEEPFRLIVTDPRFAKLPMILETPKTGPDDEQMDPVNLGLLRRLRDGG